MLLGGGSDPNIANPTGDISDNVVVHGTNIGAANKQYGITCEDNTTANPSGPDYRALVGVTCNRNVIANALNSSASLAITTGPAGVTYGTSTNANIVYNWPVGQHTSGSFLDHTRDLAKYAGTLGFTATLAGAVAQLQLQRRDAWTCANIVAYVRAGYGPP